MIQSCHKTRSGDNAVYCVSAGLCCLFFRVSARVPVIVLITALLRMTSKSKHRKRCGRDKLDFQWIAKLFSVTSGFPFSR